MRTLTSGQTAGQVTYHQCRTASVISWPLFDRHQMPRFPPRQVVHGGLHHKALQSQKAVTAYLKSKQLLPFGLAQAHGKRGIPATQGVPESITRPRIYFALMFDVWGIWECDQVTSSDVSHVIRVTVWQLCLFLQIFLFPPQGVCACREPESVVLILLVRIARVVKSKWYHTMVISLRQEGWTTRTCQHKQEHCLPFVQLFSRNL